MNCHDVEALLGAYMDAELAPAQHDAVDRHLAQCAHCRQTLAQQQLLSRQLRSSGLYRPAPDELKQSLNFSSDETGYQLRPAWPLFLTGAITALLLVSMGLNMVWFDQHDARQAEQVLSAHVRSLVSGHLTDIQSGDQHTVKPWFTGKLAFAPRVGDYSGQGYALLGGRLEYIERQQTAALAYQHREHKINLFMLPSDEEDEALSVREQDGYHLLYWCDKGMAYWLVSDMEAKELREFADIIRARGDAG